MPSILKKDSEKFNREIRKTIRFSKEEFIEIEKKLFENNLTFSDFARASILNKKIKSKLTFEMIYQFQKIGNNLNQIAKKLNKNSDVPNSEVLKMMIEIQNEIKKVQL